ncbi:MAG: hypothetical protein HS132_03450 [Planctomycetia bacterium]|nr:hypothetical protein [Planctomycetia bacterium]
MIVAKRQAGRKGAKRPLGKGLKVHGGLIIAVGIVRKNARALDKIS